MNKDSTVSHKGILVVVCGPSGVGKGTVLNLVEERNEKLKFSVSATTRNPREGEIEGRNYFFVTTDKFKEMISRDELVEWVEYCGNYYGTPQKSIEESLKNGYDVILEIEVEGATNIKRKFPDSILIFLLPPSFDELKKRLEGRGTENSEIITKRIERAKVEMGFVKNFDYVIINDEVNRAADNLNNILASERLKVKRNENVLSQIGLI